MPYLFVIAEMIGAVCLVTAILDMGMNGGRDARWAPYGLIISGIAGAIMWITG